MYSKQRASDSEFLDFRKTEFEYTQSLNILSRVYEGWRGSVQLPSAYDTQQLFTACSAGY